MEKWIKRWGILLSIILFVVGIVWLLSADRVEPNNPIASEADNLRIELMEAGSSDSSQDTDSSGELDNSQTQEETEKPEEASEQQMEEEIEPEEMEESEEQENQDEPEQAEESEEQKNPDESEKPENSENTMDEPVQGDEQVPSDNGDENTEQPGNGDENGEEEPGLVTDLYDRIVTVSELENNVLPFYAYYSDEKVDAQIKVNYKHKSDSGNGIVLNPEGINYEAKLKLGINYITIYFYDANGQRQYTRFVITYQAEKADEETPEVGEHPPIIKTGLDDWVGPIKTREFTLTVHAETWEGKQIHSNHIEVRKDGELVTNPTGSSTYEYELYFEAPRQGDSAQHTITVLAWDDEGNSKLMIYHVEFQNSADGDTIGAVTVVIDATTIGLGILDSDTVELKQGETVAHAVTVMLDNNGYEFEYGGTLSNGFYLRSITRGDTFKGAAIDSRLRTLLERDSATFTKSCSRDSLAEHDFTKGSGWMYSVNGSLYPGKSMSAWKLNDGDTVYIRFTLSYGKDVGGSVSGYGSMTNYCGLWINDSFIALDHDFQESGRVEPTESVDGYVEYTCTKCHEVKQEVLPATGVPEGTPTPELTPTPENTPTPEETPTPEATPTPEETPTPEATPTPEETPTPETTPTPEITPPPEVTPEQGE